MGYYFSTIVTNRSLRSGLLVLLSIFITETFYAQENLVFNGDFEEYDTCPTGASDPSQNPKEITKCFGWNTPTYGTSDYFNTCATGTNVSVPINALGEQNPFSGEGYLGGFFTSYNGGAGDDGYSGIMWWEYIQGQLISPLEQGKIYKLSMEVSLAEASDLMIDEVGVLFSNYSISSPNTAALNNIPQCVFSDSNYFTDTVNWIHVESYFQASGGERFITIGNFRDNLQTDTLRRYNLEPTGHNPFFTYFYIDHVVLTLANFDVPNIFTPNEDGLNDLWYPVPTKLNTIFPNWTCEIFNRWGNSLYRFSESEPGWNGMDQEGREVTDGVYYYKVYYSYGVKSGSIQLIR